jgi:sugar lactone lactonase YvrE
MLYPGRSEGTMRLITLLSGLAVALSLDGCSDQSISIPMDASSNPRLPAPQSLTPGRVKTVFDLRPLIDMPEGIAIDHSGNILISNRRRLNGDLRICEVLQLTPDNRLSVLATLDPGVRNDAVTGTAGLVIGPQGEVYAALVSHHPATHGVWRIIRGHTPERLVGSQEILLPNALAFDAEGNLYVTDSQDGAVWRFPRSGQGHRWIRHELLSGPNLGANGIAFVPPNQLFVANTDRALIARILIEPDGSPSKPKVVAQGFELLTIDGLAADAQGMLHAVIVIGEVLGVAPLVQVNPETGEIQASATNTEGFDFPTSLTIGAGTRDTNSVYIVNAGLFPEGRSNARPGIVRVALQATSDGR